MEVAGISGEEQVDPAMGADPGRGNICLGSACLASELLNFVRGKEAQLDVEAGRLAADAAALPLDGPDRQKGMDQLETEAAYTAGQRRILEHLIGALRELTGPEPTSETPDQATE
jgi:hypothetical protein